MSILDKPSTPIINGSTITINAVPGAVKYNLYKIKYIIGGVIMSDGKLLLTSDNKVVLVKEQGGE